ncbi:hypothetical protein [Rhodobacter maris]|uniref:Exostosin family protein n=1 Tax=Rhodobacter maris TaxID=446682 RepID=A0A285T1J8_9RHOB|nr:hypothetical protein [Rhodobacter maris]SOC15183.1 hypothetical protein SAMN05877831_11336 [Rhodobacter maris]
MTELFLSTRLFPKGKGADAYKITGIAALCDWVVLSDNREPRICIVRKDQCESPRHLFLSMRDPFGALSYFATEVLPRLTRPFVLVSGSEDVTLPRQTDKRWRDYNAAEQAQIATILDHPLLLHWFAENLVDDSRSAMSPLPLGLVNTDSLDRPLAFPSVPPLAERPLRVLCAHRMRQGPQWDARRRVMQWATGPWAEFVTVLHEEVPEPEFLRQVEAHAFVLCVEGGGVDPAPKSWQSMIHGAIPILRRQEGIAGAYSELPVVFVDDWNAGTLTLEKLYFWWREAIAGPHWQGGEGGSANRLSLSFWWQKIESVLPG